MHDRRLQKRYLVTGLHRLITYNVVMSLPRTHEIVGPMASSARTHRPRRGPTRIRRAGLAAVALLGVGVLAAACAGGPPTPGVASAGRTTTTTGPPAPQSGSAASRQKIALAFVTCMRTHGEPNMPEPSVSGDTVHISATSGSAVDPNSPQFIRANNACKHLLPSNGVAPANAITPADQADYLKAAECMRSHGVPNFPDPTFENNHVEFNATGASIDTDSPGYKGALATCQKLIPAGLPDGPTGS
jgi:hypothetical protein